MRKIFVATFIIIFAMTLSAEKVASFPDMMRPVLLAVDDDQLYVTEGVSVSIFSLRDYSFKTKFGKAGEGPREFMTGQGGFGLVMVFPMKDKLLINSIGKVSYFTKDGEFIDSFKAPGGVPSLSMFQPIGDGFAGMGFDMGENQSMSLTINLYDANLEKTKTIHSQKFMQRGSLSFPMVTPIFYVHKNRIVLGGEEGFAINFFDINGKKVSSINRDYKLLKVTEKYKQGVLDFLKTDPTTRAFFEQIKNMIKFSDIFPAIQMFFVEEGRIYIQTYKTEGDKYEFFIYTDEGEFIKSVYLPIVYINPSQVSPFTIRKDKIYQLVENDDTEEWELHITEIK